MQQTQFKPISRKSVPWRFMAPARKAMPVSALPNSPNKAQGARMTADNIQGLFLADHCMMRGLLQLLINKKSFPAKQRRNSWTRRACSSPG
jgi:hypothetical protein